MVCAFVRRTHTSIQIYTPHMSIVRELFSCNKCLVYGFCVCTVRVLCVDGLLRASRNLFRLNITGTGNGGLPGRNSCGHVELWGDPLHSAR